MMLNSNQSYLDFYAHHAISLRKIERKYFMKLYQVYSFVTQYVKKSSVAQINHS